jgi:hypothetical protein
VGASQLSLISRKYNDLPHFVESKVKQ